MYFRLTAETGETVVVEVRPDPHTEARGRSLAIRYFHRCWKWLVGDGAVVERVLCAGESGVPFGRRSYQAMGCAWYAMNGRRVRREPTTVGHVDEGRLGFPR